MNIVHVKKIQLTSSEWSGGTTTQLFIYPPAAEYSKRNFIFRISTATVEAEESVFTILPGIKRKLMVLDGSLHIAHKNKYSKHLNKFEQDEFDGGWETNAVGKVTDFNLMLAENKGGRVKALFFKSGEKSEIEFTNTNYVGIYFYKGSAEIICAGKKFNAEQGDFLSMENYSPQDKIIIKANVDCEIIIANVLVN
jgi:environmental stress-induced protein Ves